MPSPRPRTRGAAATKAALACLLAATLPFAGGCGAGLIGGVVAANGDDPPPPPPPQLSLTQTRIPLVPGPDPASSFRTVVVSNLSLPANARLKVQIEAAGAIAEQSQPVISSGQGASTVVGFALRLEPIVAAIGDPTLADVEGRLAVLVDGRAVAPAVRVELLRQPTAALVPPAGEQRVFVSPSGGEAVTLRVRGLRATRPEDLQVQVATADPSGDPEPVTRLATGVTFTPEGGDSALVTARTPANTFPGGASLVVVDAVAGQSTAVDDVWYRPDVQVALPSQGPTTGGSLVTLIGSALAPLDFSATPPRPAFDRLELAFRKGVTGAERVVVLAPQDLRTAESDLERLVFTMPASPDGRPGRVDIVLRVDLGGVTAEVTAPDVFLFANPLPVFGPRGAVLDREPIAVAPVAIEAASRPGDAPDFGVLHVEGGASHLQLLLAQDNGMFIRYGAPRRIGDPEVPDERDPRDLCAGDFTSDGVPDLFALNGGSAAARHHFIHGRRAPELPLGAVTPLATDPQFARCIAAELNGDGVADLVLVPGPLAANLRPQTWLSVVQGATVNWTRGADAPVRPGPYDAVTVGDADGDTLPDVFVATGGAAARLDVAFGAGGGAFAAQSVQIDLTTVASSLSRVAGVHSCGGPGQNSLAVVFSGIATPAVQPVVAVLHTTGPRAWALPLPADVLAVPGPIGTSLAADLLGDGSIDLVLGAADDVNPGRLGVLRWQGARFEVSEVLAEPELLAIRSLHFGVAFPADPGSPGSGARAVFALHESVVDGFRERRLSTLLVWEPQAGRPGLLPPSAGGREAERVRGLVGGEFAASASAANPATPDLGLATATGFRLLANDGFGGFFGSRSGPAVPGILPATLALARVTPAARPDALAAWTEDGRIAVWRTDLSPQAVTWSDDLRQLAPAGPLRTTLLSSASRLRSADVDGDGIADLTALLAFDLASRGEGDALLVLLRGKAAFGATEFPFHAPTVVTPVHGNASGLALGDFAPSPGPVVLELALAVPVGTTVGAADGDHVRFFRRVAGAAPGDDRFARSFDSGGAQALIAGSAPTELAASDFDGNGTVDLLVATAGDATLRLLLSDAVPAAAPGEVAIESFHESLGSPRPASPGVPKFLHLGDINGDGNVDALLTTEESTGEPRTSVAFYLSSGTGELASPVFVSPSRLGSGQFALALDLVDLNADGVPDLGVGIDDSAPTTKNVRVLFGGSR